MKRILAALSVACLVFFSTYNVTNAETVTSGEMYKTFKEHVSNEHYDFKEGSFKLTDVKTFNLSEPVTIKKGEKKIKVTKVQAGVASYKTVRDYLFIKNHKKPVYFAPDQDLVLKAGDLEGVEAIKNYKDNHPAHTSMAFGAIVALLLLVIIVPFIFLFIWHKFKYSSMEYKNQHKLHNHSPKTR